MARRWQRFVPVFVVAAVVAIGASLFISGPVTAADKTIVFVDRSWDSALAHNRVAGFIAHYGFGYEVDYLMADTIPGWEGMRRGEIDVSMETWIDNAPDLWLEPIADGRFIDLGPNFLEAPQGWYVPAYVIEGDPERGIEPMAPGLRSVLDLPDYWEVFRDPEVRRKGRFYNGPTGWVTSEHNTKKLKAYGLTDTYSNFHPGSQASLDASIARAFQRGEPWLGYYWEPTWVMGHYDMIRLEEPPYREGCLDEDGGDFYCAFASADVKIVATAPFVARAPDIAAFLRNYETELHHTNEMLAFMELNGGTPEDAALWFLREYESLWTKWVDESVATRVLAALEAFR